MSEYAGRHRTLEAVVQSAVTKSWTRRVLVPSSVAALIVFGVASTVFLFKTNTPASASPPAPEASAPNTNPLALRDTPDDRASRSEPRTIKTQPVKVEKPSVKKIKIEPEWASPLPGKKAWCNYWQWRKTYNHRGEDIAAPSGTPIHAVHAGKVKTQWDGGGGNMTIITHDGMAEVYMHQSRYKVRSGYVAAGEVIGYVGSTGDSSGPHLHLEIQPNGPWNGVTNPIKWLNNRGVRIGC